MNPYNPQGGPGKPESPIGPDPTEVAPALPAMDYPPTVLTTGRTSAGPHAPHTIPGYRILRVIASGGMGTVFEAEQLHPRRRVALKIVKAGLASEEVLSRFRFEAEVLARLDHPGIGRIYEAGIFESADGLEPYMAMEYIHGRSLLEFAKAENLTLDQRVELLARICEAVQHAHQQGIIHRDLKPANILIEPDGRPRIVDFGLARDLDEGGQWATVQTELGQIMGTIRYMSPEQAEGRHRNLDARSDVYALGVIGYELFSGRHPHRTEGRSTLEVLQAIREEDIVPISVHDSRFQGDIETIITKCLERDRTRRYQSAGEIRDDLDRYLRDEPIAARAPSMWYEIRKFAKRNRAMMAAVAALFVILLISLGVILEASRYTFVSAVSGALGDRTTKISAQLDLLAEAHQAALLRVVAERGGDLEAIRLDAAALGGVEAIVDFGSAEDFHVIDVDPRNGPLSDRLIAHAPRFAKYLAPGRVPAGGYFDDFLPAGENPDDGTGWLLLAYPRRDGGILVFVLSADFFVQQIRSAAFGQNDAIQVYSARGYMLTTTQGPPGIRSYLNGHFRGGTSAIEGEFSLRTPEFGRRSWHLIGYAKSRRLLDLIAKGKSGPPWCTLVSYDLEFIVFAQYPLIWFSIFTALVWPLILLAIAIGAARRRLAIARIKI